MLMPKDYWIAAPHKQRFIRGSSSRELRTQQAALRVLRAGHFDQPFLAARVCEFVMVPVMRLPARRRHLPHRLQETVSGKLGEPARAAAAPESAASAPLPEHLPPARALSTASTGSPMRMSSLSKGAPPHHSSLAFASIAHEQPQQGCARTP